MEHMPRAAAVAEERPALGTSFYLKRGGKVRKRFRLWVCMMGYEHAVEGKWEGGRWDQLENVWQKNEWAGRHCCQAIL